MDSASNTTHQVNNITRPMQYHRSVQQCAIAEAKHDFIEHDLVLGNASHTQRQEAEFYSRKFNQSKSCSYGKDSSY